MLHDYTFDRAKQQIAKLLTAACGPEAEVVVNAAPAKIPGDLAVPIFREAKRAGTSPKQLATELAETLDVTGTLFSEVTAAGGFVNFTYDPERLARGVFEDLRQHAESYGHADVGGGRAVIVDYSSPNIAKPFSVGHLRSTVIGQAVCNLYRARGYNVVGDNHIGDWGTQFGKLMCAFHTWGDREVVDANPIEELLALYVRFHEEAEDNAELAAEGRRWFQRLEEGDTEAVELWTWFRDISWREFERTYDFLGGITFDEVLGESFYNDKLEGIVKTCLERRLAVFPSRNLYDTFAERFPAADEILAPHLDALEVKRTQLTLSPKAWKKLPNQGIPEEAVAQIEDLAGQPIEGQKRLEALLAERFEDAKLRKKLAKQFQRQTESGEVVFFGLDDLSASEREALGSDADGVEAWSELERLARPVASWGEIPGEEGGDEVALIHLNDFGIETPLLIQKSDGTSLYATRDLATVHYRRERWDPAKLVYVVGGEQQLYFRQLFLAARLLGDRVECTHPWFGLVRLPEGKMSTRKGRVIFLEDVLAEAVRRAEEILVDREMSAEEKAEVARVIGVGAVKYADLSQERTTEVVFEWDKMLNLQGNSAPYLQYTRVRLGSILRKAEEEIGVGADALGDADGGLLTGEKEQAVVRRLARFPEAIAAATSEETPHLIANYLFALAQDVNTFYNSTPVIPTEDEELRRARLALCASTGQVMESGLALLGIECPPKM